MNFKFLTPEEYDKLISRLNYQDITLKLQQKQILLLGLEAMKFNNKLPPNVDYEREHQRIQAEIREWITRQIALANKL